ncbi:DUF6186 family protein [Pedococcus sp. 2YAF34]|uniref:DUF6186 family protein n=1 Tax=Pedococcus sp. 2YAF34 TaxID=3233032 RepID=UPI003F95DFD9
MTARALTATANVALLACLVVLAAVAQRRPDVVPRVSEVVREAARTRAGQLLLLLVWWWLGWHFLLAA